MGDTSPEDMFRHHKDKAIKFTALLSKNYPISDAVLDNLDHAKTERELIFAINSVFAENDISSSDGRNLTFLLRLLQTIRRSANQ